MTWRCHEHRIITVSFNIMTILPLTTSLSFFTFALILALAPGPDNLFVCMQSALHGRRAGFSVVLGLCTGLLGHTAAVALGLAAVLATSSWALTLIKLLGVAYLTYLAWQAWRAPAQTLIAPAGAVLSQHQLYWRGIFMNLSNPKVTLFFLAFLPQFTQPQLGPVAGQVVYLGALFMLATFIVFGCIAYSAGWFGEKLLRSSRAQRWLNRIAAILFVGLAIRLMFTKQ